MRVQLLLAVAYERSGRRSEAAALHEQWGTHGGLHDGADQEHGSVEDGHERHRSLHHGGVRRLQHTSYPLRAINFWRHDALPADVRLLLQTLEGNWRTIAQEASAS